MSRLDRSPWPEVAVRAEAGDVLLVPVGSTEQHGPHLPVTTDVDIAVALANGAADRQDGLVVAPALAYGASGEHEGFAGTLSIGRAATELVLLELGRSAGRHFTAVVLISTHGGNAEPVDRAIGRLREEGHPVRAWSPRWPGDLHAGRTETSLMLAIAPGRVRLDRAEAGDRRPITEVWPELRHHGVRAVSANGVLGDPSGATAAEGRALLTGAVEALLGDVVSRPRPAGDSRVGR